MNFSQLRRIMENVYLTDKFQPEWAVLMSLAYHADKEVPRAFPSYETIAREARISARAVPMMLARLEAADFITIEHGGAGQGKRNAYLLHVEKGQTLSKNVRKLTGHERQITANRREDESLADWENETEESPLYPERGAGNYPERGSLNGVQTKDFTLNTDALYPERGSLNLNAHINKESFKVSKEIPPSRAACAPTREGSDYFFDPQEEDAKALASACSVNPIKPSDRDLEAWPSALLTVRNSLETASPGERAALVAEFRQWWLENPTRNGEIRTRLLLSQVTGHFIRFLNERNRPQPKPNPEVNANTATNGTHRQFMATSAPRNVKRETDAERRARLRREDFDFIEQQSYSESTYRGR